MEHNRKIGKKSQGFFIFKTFSNYFVGAQKFFVAEFFFDFSSRNFCSFFRVILGEPKCANKSAKGSGASVRDFIRTLQRNVCGCHSKTFSYCLGGLEIFLFQNFSSIFLREIFAIVFALLFVYQNVRPNQRRG